MNPLDPNYNQTVETISPETQPNRVESLPIRLSELVTPEEWARLTYEQRLILMNLDHLPQDISDIPQDVWNTLSDDQKINLLINRGVIPVRGEVVEIAELGGDEVQEYTEQMPQGEVDIAGTVESRRELEESRERVQEIEREHQQNIEQVSEDEPDITNSRSDSFGDSGLAVNISGNPIPQHLFENPMDHVDGRVDLGGTWISNIINKLLNARAQ